MGRMEEEERRRRRGEVVHPVPRRVSPPPPRWCPLRRCVTLWTGWVGCTWTTTTSWWMGRRPDDDDIGQWGDRLLVSLKAAFHRYRALMQWGQTAVVEPSQILRAVGLGQPRSPSPPPAAGSPLRVRLACSRSVDGNVLEAINCAVSIFDQHYVDRDLYRTGQNIVLCSAGQGLFLVSEGLAQLTKQRMVDGGIGCDLICMTDPPLHAAPLFIYDPHMLTDPFSALYPHIACGEEREGHVKDEGPQRPPLVRSTSTQDAHLQSAAPSFQRSVPLDALLSSPVVLPTICRTGFLCSSTTTSICSTLRSERGSSRRRRLSSAIGLRGPAEQRNRRRRLPSHVGRRRQQRRRVRGRLRRRRRGGRRGVVGRSVKVSSCPFGAAADGVGRHGGDGGAGRWAAWHRSPDGSVLESLVRLRPLRRVLSVRLAVRLRRADVRLVLGLLLLLPATLRIRCQVQPRRGRTAAAQGAAPASLPPPQSCAAYDEAVFGFRRQTGGASREAAVGEMRASLSSALQPISGLRRAVTSGSSSCKGGSVPAAAPLPSTHSSAVPLFPSFSPVVSWSLNFARRWAHLFSLREDGRSSLLFQPNWKSLCKPAMLPLTVDYLQSAEELRLNYVEYNYTLTLSDEHDNEALLEEIICQRQAQDYQNVQLSAPALALLPSHSSSPHALKQQMAALGEEEEGWGQWLLGTVKLLEAERLLRFHPGLLPPAAPSHAPPPSFIRLPPPRPLPP